MLPRYDIHQTYEWNYAHAPDPVEIDVPHVAGNWKFCGLPVGSPLGMPAGPLLNGRWCLYYAGLGFDVLTYKTVRSRERGCYPLPNLQPVRAGVMRAGEAAIPAVAAMNGSWAVSFGMPSKSPDIWRADVQSTRDKLPRGKLLSVSVVGTIQPGWSIDDLAADYAQCARWAVESGADCVETNFSCPNVATCDGQLYQQSEQARIVAASVRQAIGRVPFIVKIGHMPHAEEAEALVDALHPDVDALAMTNSVASKVVGPDGALLFDGQPRGICGPAILETSLRQVSMFAEVIARRRMGMRLVGVGGATTAEDVAAYLQSGADAVHIATAAMLDPLVATRIRQTL